jgi:hypothetical protein
MGISLKTNYRFEDLLLDEAIKAEAEGDDVLALALLHKAENAKDILKKSRERIRKNVVCAESTLEFANEFWLLSEHVSWHDAPTTMNFRKAQFNRKKRRRLLREKWKKQNKVRDVPNSETVLHMGIENK